MDGKVQQLDNGFVITFERELTHPRDKVWDAITSTDRISTWLAGPGSTIDLRIGGRVYLSGHEIESTVVDLDPPRVIEYGFKGEEWDGGTVRWELSDSGTGTRLVLIHRNPSMMNPEQERKLLERHGLDLDEYPTIPRTMAGWHTILDRLAVALDGGPSLADDHWKRVYERYAEIKTRG
jgi:uncharacterized protein YndB with AHSA1/START domain